MALFFSAPEHLWIRKDRTFLARLTDLFTLIPAADLECLIVQRKLLLIYSDARFSCAFHQFRGREVVLVFPDLLRLIHSAEFPLAQAVLAHEFGHVVLGHSKARISEAKAQIEADQYARELGFGEELSRVLEEFPYTQELKRRLDALA